jgi:Winged helix domain
VRETRGNNHLAGSGSRITSTELRSFLEGTSHRSTAFQVAMRIASDDWGLLTDLSDPPRAQCKPYRAPVVRLDDDSILTVEGDDARALSRLVHAGEHGCTPINNPVPRWCHYVWEAHSGAYAGHNARYVFRNALTVIAEVRRDASPR